jgi:hypothetical protein
MLRAEVTGPVGSLVCRAAPLPAASLQPTLTQLEAGICFANELLSLFFLNSGNGAFRLELPPSSPFSFFLVSKSTIDFLLQHQLRLLSPYC